MDKVIRRRAEWLDSRLRSKMFRVGDRVDPTAAAPERYYGMYGIVTCVRRADDWQAYRPNECSVMVDWYVDGATYDDLGQLIVRLRPKYVGKVHKLPELKLSYREVWDEDEKFPAPPAVPAPEPKQLRIGDVAG